MKPSLATTAAIVALTSAAHAQHWTHDRSLHLDNGTATARMATIPERPVMTPWTTRWGQTKIKKLRLKINVTETDLLTNY